jgi:hypothetical protein
LSVADQWRFLRDVVLLVQWAERRGYVLTGGDLYRDADYAQLHASGLASRHHARQAIDLNLFVDGQYLASTLAHAEMGYYWESLDEHNRWGGRYDDGNHYERLDSPRDD